MTVHNEAFREDIKTHEAGVGRYFVIYILLVILTFGTFGVAKLHMSESLHLAAALLIAVCKASLVVLFFMHLLEAEGANRAVFLVSILFVGVMMFFILVDTAHRFPLTNPIDETTVNLPGGNPVYSAGAHHAEPGEAGQPQPGPAGE